LGIPLNEKNDYIAKFAVRDINIKLNTKEALRGVSKVLKNRLN